MILFSVGLNSYCFSPGFNPLGGAPGIAEVGGAVTGSGAVVKFSFAAGMGVPSVVKTG
jgi:hypothetical protein